MTIKALSILNKNSNREMNVIERLDLCIRELTGNKYNVGLEHDFEKDQLALQGNTFLVGPACNVHEVISLMEDYITQKEIQEALL